MKGRRERKREWERERAQARGRLRLNSDLILHPVQHRAGNGRCNHVTSRWHRLSNGASTEFPINQARSSCCRSRLKLSDNGEVELDRILFLKDRIYVAKSCDEENKMLFSLIDQSCKCSLCYSWTRKVSNSEGVCKNLNRKDMEVYRACRIYQQIFLGEKKTENWKFKNAT